MMLTRGYELTKLPTCSEMSETLGLYTIGVLDYWTGLLDYWTHPKKNP